MTWITTANVRAETWRRLLEYANTDIALGAMASVHGAPPPSHYANYRKQATQIRVSLLQAREYFSAAEASSVFTSPNHLYYGMMSLASAVMLLLGDGDVSLDRLRQTTRNRNHGLELAVGVNAKLACRGLRLLSETRVSARSHGLFLNWYRTLPRREDIFGLLERIDAHGTTMTTRARVGGQALLGAAELQDASWSLLSLFQYMPDFAGELARYGADVPASRVGYRVAINDSESTRRYQWRLHGARTELDRETILGAFESPACYWAAWTVRLSSPEFAAVIDLDDPREDKTTPLGFTFPTIRDTLYQSQVIYSRDLTTPEIVDAYIAGYGLSMLSRYFPDLWIACIESHCAASKLIEYFTYIMMDKFPLLALRALSREDVIISPHSPNWHS